jgi:hypothetical protein
VCQMEHHSSSLASSSGSWKMVTTRDKRKLSQFKISMGMQKLFPSNRPTVDNAKDAAFKHFLVLGIDSSQFRATHRPHITAHDPDASGFHQSLLYEALKNLSLYFTGVPITNRLEHYPLVSSPILLDFCEPASSAFCSCFYHARKERARP